MENNASIPTTTEDESNEVEGQRFIAPVPGAEAATASGDGGATAGGEDGEVEGHRFIAPEASGTA